MNNINNLFSNKIFVEQLKGIKPDDAFISSAINCYYNISVSYETLLNLGHNSELKEKKRVYKELESRMNMSLQEKSALASHFFDYLPKEKRLAHLEEKIQSISDEGIATKSDAKNRFRYYFIQVIGELVIRHDLSFTNYESSQAYQVIDLFKGKLGYEIGHKRSISYLQEYINSKVSTAQ